MPDKQHEQIRGHCPNCGPGRYSNILHCHSVSDDDEENGIWGNTDSYMLECAGCKTVYFQETSMFSEDTDEQGRPIERVVYYPAPAKRDRPDWFSIINLENGLYRLLTETYNALDVDARILAAAGARIVFDRVSELLKIDPALSFKEKLDRLVNGGHISPSERAQLDVLVDAGGAAAHRAWKPTPQQLNTIMTVVEAFIHRKFVLEHEVKRMKKEIPRRQRRKKTRL